MNEELFLSECRAKLLRRSGTPFPYTFSSFLSDLNHEERLNNARFQRWNGDMYRILMDQVCPYVVSDSDEDLHSDQVRAFLKNSTTDISGYIIGDMVAHVYFASERDAMMFKMTFQ